MICQVSMLYRLLQLPYKKTQRHTHQEKVEYDEQRIENADLHLLDVIMTENAIG